MTFLVGAGLLVAAVVLLPFAQALLNRPSSSRDPDAFGAAEAIAFLLTTMLTVGTAIVIGVLQPGWTLLALAEIVGIFAAVALLAALTGRALRRSDAVAASPELPIPAHARRGRSGPEGEPIDAAGSGRRRATA